MSHYDDIYYESIAKELESILPNKFRLADLLATLKPDEKCKIHDRFFNAYVYLTVCYADLWLSEEIRNRTVKKIEPLNDYGQGGYFIVLDDRDECEVSK